MTFFRWERYPFEDAWMLTVCGVTLRRTVHQEPTPAPSGAHLAIDSSIWLSTRRHAIGFGRVRDWACLTSIEVRPPGAGPFVTETGDAVIAPAIMLDSSPFDVWIANRSPVTAEGRLAVRIDDQWEIRAWTIEPGALRRIEFQRRAASKESPSRLDWIRYQTQPIGDHRGARFARIYGRPEFGIDVP
jgi:hypothetical protein